MPKLSCQAQTKDGRPCSAAATESGLCFFHGSPNKASELGRMGGRRNRYGATAPAEPLPPLNTAMAVRQTVTRLIQEVHSGKLHPRVASALAPLLALQLRAIETSDLEQRLERYERFSNFPRAQTFDLANRISDAEKPSDAVKPEATQSSEAHSVEGQP